MANVKSDNSSDSTHSIGNHSFRFIKRPSSWIKPFFRCMEPQKLFTLSFHSWQHKINMYAIITTDTLRTINSIGIQKYQNRDCSCTFSSAPVHWTPILYKKCEENQSWGSARRTSAVCARGNRCYLAYGKQGVLKGFWETLQLSVTVLSAVIFQAGSFPNLNVFCHNPLAPHYQQFGNLCPLHTSFSNLFRACRL